MRQFGMLNGQKVLRNLPLLAQNPAIICEHSREREGQSSDDKDRYKRERNNCRSRLVLHDQRPGLLNRTGSAVAHP